MLLRMFNCHLSALAALCRRYLLILGGRSQAWQMNTKDLECATDEQPTYNHKNVEPELRIKET
jgi:hypothetical protein